MSSSLRFPVPHAVRAAHIAREVQIETVDQLAQRIAPGRTLEVDGVRWSVSATEALGCVVLLATHAAEHGELLRVRAEVPRRGRTLDDDELADELDCELREHIAAAFEGVLEMADRVRTTRGDDEPGWRALADLLDALGSSRDDVRIAGVRTATARRAARATR